MRRNEVGVRGQLGKPFLDAGKHVQQRMTTMLRDVHYRVCAQVWVHPEAEEQNAAKWRDQFRRRLQRGQTFRTPFLGMREFHADVQPSDDTPAIDWTEELGLVLHTIWVDGRGGETYEFFEARVTAGRMDVPPNGFLMGRRAS
jgi:CRISPR-associated protein Cas5d